MVLSQRSAQICDPFSASISFAVTRSFAPARRTEPLHDVLNTEFLCDLPNICPSALVEKC